LLGSRRFPGEFDDDVVHRLDAGGGGGGEGVDVEAVCGGFRREVGGDEFFCCGVAGGADGAPGCGGEEVFGEGVGGGAGDLALLGLGGEDEQQQEQ